MANNANPDTFGFSMDVDAELGAGAKEEEAEMPIKRTASRFEKKRNASTQLAFKKEDTAVLAYYFEEGNAISVTQAESLLGDDSEGTFIFLPKPLEEGAEGAYSMHELLLVVKQQKHQGEGSLEIEAHPISVFSTMVKAKDATKHSLDTMVHTFSFKNKMHTGPFFTSLTEFAQHYKTSPYSRDDFHVLKLPLDPRTGDSTVHTGPVLAVGEIGKVKINIPKWYKHKAFWGVITVLVYFFIGCLYYMQVEGWTFDEALYFCVVVCTTVGYGDNPSITSHRTMLFTTAFVFCGVAIVLAAIGQIFDILSRKARELDLERRKQSVLKFNADNGLGETEEEEAVQRQGSISASRAGAPRKTSTGGLVRFKKIGGGRKKVGKSQLDKDGNRLPLWTRIKQSRMLRAFLFLVVVMAVGMLFMCLHKEVYAVCGDDDQDGTCVTTIYNETLATGNYTITEVTHEVYKNFDFVEGLYWCTITGTTVGFGDYSAGTSGSRWFLIFYLFFIVVAMGNFISAIQAWLTTSMNRDDIFKITLDADLIRRLDKSGDGKISKIEWLAAMLISLEVTDEHLIRLIIEQFDHLNVDGDEFLSMEDVAELGTLSVADRAEYEEEATEIFDKGQARMAAEEDEARRQGGFKTGVFRHMGPQTTNLAV